jgi:hypothetical protein
MTLDQIWTACLGELRLQMTKATFHTWVAPTQALEWENGNFVIGVPTAFVQDWLENRLKSTIERTLVGIVGQPVRVTLLVTESADPGPDLGPKAALELGPDDVAVKFYRFDPRELGFLQTPKYDWHFWQPLLGCVAFATYQLFRCEEQQNSGWGGWFIMSVKRIACTLGVHRQQITGAERKRRDGSGKYWQSGAFDALQEAGIARIETQGSGRNLSYLISVLHSLPLLTPTQVETLDPILQEQHAKWLRRADLEQKEWIQLKLPTLVQ